MASFTIGEIVQATGAEPIVGVAPDRQVHSFACDSRDVGEGTLFVAFVGERVDGNDYVPDVIRAGAACACLTRPPSDETVALARSCGCALLRACDDDGEEFLLRLAHVWREAHPQWLVVGVTGSVGKTTTKEMLAAGIGATRRVHATQGNLNSLIGMPLSLLAAPEDADAVVLEMGMNAAGEIGRLSACACPDVAVITNVGTSHIGMLGGRDAIAAAKAEIVEGMRVGQGRESTLVLSAGDEYTPYIIERHALPAGVAVTCAGDATGDVWAEGLTLDAQGRASFVVRFRDGLSCPVRLGIPGGHVVDDALLALAAIDRLGVDRVAAARAIEELMPGSMRLATIDVEGGPCVIDDSYNASPASMAAALDVLASLSCDGRRVAVLGEMGELGDEADRLHGYVGAYAAAKSVDLLACVGTAHAPQMAEAARIMGLPRERVVGFATVDAAVEALAPQLRAGDVVLAKGSRAAGLDRFVRGVVSHAR